MFHFYQYDFGDGEKRNQDDICQEEILGRVASGNEIIWKRWSWSWSHGIRIPCIREFPKVKVTVNSLIPLKSCKKFQKRKERSRLPKINFEESDFNKLQGLHPSFLMSTSDLPQENIQWTAWKGSFFARRQVNILTSIDQMNQFEQGQVLVADMTDPDWEPIMILGSWTSKPMEDSKEFYVFCGSVFMFPSKPR